MKINLLKKVQRYTEHMGANAGRHGYVGPHAFACIRSYSGRRIWSYERTPIRHAGEQEPQAVRCIGYTLKQAIHTHNQLKERSK